MWRATAASASFTALVHDRICTTHRCRRDTLSQSRTNAGQEKSDPSLSHTISARGYGDGPWELFRASSTNRPVEERDDSNPQEARNYGFVYRPYHKSGTIAQDHRERERESLQKIIPRIAHATDRGCDTTEMSPTGEHADAGYDHSKSRLVKKNTVNSISSVLLRLLHVSFS